MLCYHMISLDGQTDGSDDEIIIEELNVEKAKVAKSSGGDTGRDGALMRSSQEGSSEGLQQDVVGQQKGENLPLLVKLS